MISITVSVKPQSARRDYDLLYVLPEFEVEGMSRPEKNNSPACTYGLPPTVKFLEIAGVALSTDGETYNAPTYNLLLNRFRLKAPPAWSDSKIKSMLAGFLKDGVCYTDHTGGWAWNQIVTCGNVLYPIGNTKNMGGELYYEIRQLKADTYGRMSAELQMFPHLETWATISTRGYGGAEVTPFPHLEGRDVPALLFCKTSTNWVRSSRVRMLDRDEPIPRLYFP